MSKKSVAVRCHCGALMKLLKGKNSTLFYGCSNYPRCKGSKSIGEAENNADNAHNRKFEANCVNIDPGYSIPDEEYQYCNP